MGETNLQNLAIIDNFFTFSSKDTIYIKGIALMLMFASHLFTFPEWLETGNNFISIPFCSGTIAYFIGKFGSICVGIFIFLTGYGMYYSYLKENCFIKSIKKAVKFLLKYWIILFTFFLPIHLLMGRTYFNPAKLHQELLGVYTSIVGFAWYVRFYVLAMLTLPVLKQMLRKNACLSVIISIIPFQIISLSLRYLSTKITFHNAEAVAAEYFKYISIVLLGYCFSKYRLFEKLNKLLLNYNLNNIFVYILGVAAIFALRIKMYDETNIYLPNMDIVYVPILLFFFVKIVNSIETKPLLESLEIVGKNSMNLWFLQSIFFFETKDLQWIVYLPKFSIIILIWNIIILLPISKLYNIIFKKLHIL